MKKNSRKNIMTLLALAVVVACTFFMGINVQAAKTNTYKYDSKHGILWNGAVRTTLNNHFCTVEVYLENPGDYIASVKVNKSGVYAKNVVESIYGENSGVSVPGYENKSFKRKNLIQILALKKGKYTVTYTIKNKSKKTVAKKKMTVYAGYDTNPVDTVTYAGKKFWVFATDQVELSVQKSSGKLKIKPGNGYKITKIEVANTYKNNKPVYKKVKNGAKIKLAKSTKYKVTNTETETVRKDGYVYKYWEGTGYDYLKPVTMVRITYYDKLLKIYAQYNLYIVNAK